MKLDHFAWSSPSLEKAIDELETWSGVWAAPGGSHPGMGTRNALLSLGTGLYLALDAPDPEQPLVGNNGARMAAQGGYNMDLFAVSTTDIEQAQAVLREFDIASEQRSGSRRTQQGALLKWTHLAVEANRFGNALPQISRWETDNHPSAEAPRGCSLESFKVAHPDAGAVRDLYAALGLDTHVGKASSPSLLVSLQSPRGQFILPTGQGRP